LAPTYSCLTLQLLNAVVINTLFYGFLVFMCTEQWLTMMELDNSLEYFAKLIAVKFFPYLTCVCLSELAFHTDSEGGISL